MKFKHCSGSLSKNAFFFGGGEDYIFMFRNFSYLMYSQHAVHVQLISWLNILWCWVLSSLVINLPKDVCGIFYYNSRDGEVFFLTIPIVFLFFFVVHFVANMIWFYHSVLFRKKSSKISISVNEALLRESSKASKPVHGELYIHGELSDTVWLWLCCSERRLRSVFKPCTLLCLCACGCPMGSCCTASTNEPRKLGLG